MPFVDPLHMVSFSHMPFVDWIKALLRPHLSLGILVKDVHSFQISGLLGINLFMRPLPPYFLTLLNVSRTPIIITCWFGKIVT
jgi:hypothetical protein